MLPHPPHDAFVRDFLADLDQCVAWMKRSEIQETPGFL
jgi:hypothetical protein